MKLNSSKPLLACPIKGVVELLPYDFQELEPLLQQLSSGDSIERDLAFPKGTLRPDGRLDLCKQALGPEGCSFVVEALWNNDFVKSLLMGTDGIGDAGAEKIAQLIQHNSNLETIYLGCNYIQAEGVRRIAEALKDNQSVKGLWLKRNPIGTQGAEHIASLLVQNKHLKVLDLVNTGIGEEGLKLICNALLQNNSLERIYLGGNSIDKKGAIYLASVLRENKTLKALMMNVGNLGNEGCSILAGTLKQNTTITEFGIASNGIESIGLSELFETLPSSSINYLDVGYSPSTNFLGARANSIIPSGIESLSRYLSLNPVLKTLVLTNTGTTFDDLVKLSGSLENNTNLCRITVNGKVPENLLLKLRQNQSLLSESKNIPGEVAIIKSVYR